MSGRGTGNLALASAEAAARDARPAPAPAPDRPWRTPNLFSSFRCALRGLAEVTATERNMKLHVWAGLGVCVAASEVLLPMEAQLALLVVTTLVLGAEAMNTALEAMVDLHTSEIREPARRVKDAAAGAVLAVALGAAAVAAVVVGHCWDRIAGLGQLRGHVPEDAAIVVAGAALLALGRGRLAARLAAVATGGALLAHLFLRTVSVPLTAAAAALFLLASASAFSPPAKEGNHDIRRAGTGD